MNPALERVKQAVIDIGSNSVRLVIYDGPRRAPFPIVNEKALCGLGRDMSEGGTLNPKAVESALETLGRFKRLLEEHDDPPTLTVATAAVREAGDGAAFVQRVKKLGFDVAMIGGEEEAGLAAFGVASFEPGATGLVGDMGGGSLELIAMKNGEAGDAVSLSIGPLRLMQISKGETKAAGKEIVKALERVSWLKPKRFDALYAVGGAWRSIARINMQLWRYPLPVLHHYELTARQAGVACDLVSRQSKSSLETTPGVSSKRVETLPYAALVMRSLLDYAKIKTVSVSAGGLREGLLYRALSPAERVYDPLFAGASFFASRMAPEKDAGAAYDALLEGVFADDAPAQRRIRKATCLLADIGAFFHPDLRAEHAFDTALRAPFYAVTHQERAVIALSLYCRHEGAAAPSEKDAILAMMSDEERRRATEIGLALRFAAGVAPKSPETIGRCSLKRTKQKLIFTAPSDLKALMDETPRKRLGALAETLRLEPELQFEG